jgi:hypothetical protein
MSDSVSKAGITKTELTLNANQRGKNAGIVIVNYSSFGQSLGKDWSKKFRKQSEMIPTFTIIIGEMAFING